MNHRILSTTRVIRSHKNQILAGLAIIVGMLALAVAILLFLQSRQPNIIYEPVNACDLLTKGEAQELLGKQTLQSDAKAPVVTEDVATSRCGYTDGNPDVNAMRVAAIVVRSAVNDDGVEQNNNEFAASETAERNESVNDVGDRAFYNAERGQLNIQDGQAWIILSFGVGSAPEANTLDDAIVLAKEVTSPATPKQ